MIRMSVARKRRGLFDAAMTAALPFIAAIMLGAMPGAAHAVPQHPLDALEDTEILAAADILLNAGTAHPGAVFQSIELHEPAKDVVLGFQPGQPIPRSATVFFRQDKRSFRTVVNLANATFSPPVEIPIRDGQLGLTFQEIIDFGFALSDGRLLNALSLRGIDTPAELSKVLFAPLTSGSFSLPEERRRIVKAQMYFIDGAGINLYARPIEGIQAIIDLDDQTVVQVLDSGVVPVPADNHSFDEATVDSRFGLRPELKPIRITQPDGVNFMIDGSFVQWQKWRFHVRFDRRAGPVISLVTYDGRPVLYQGTLAEIFVPYQDPSANWYYRTFMDEGEFGFGALASPLSRGLDVPENAVLLNGLISAALPDPQLPVVPLPLENVIGVFERVTGNPEWRHFEFLAGGLYEGRAGVELVVRAAAQVGNYDYIIDWVFTQSGVIRVDVGLTGIDTPKAVLSTRIDNSTGPGDTRYGTLVAPYLVAPFHSHHFCFRLDLDVDGPRNSFALGRLKIRDDLGNSPRESVWILEERALKKEKDARLDEDNSVWRVLSAGRTNAQGYNTSYVLESEGNAEPLLEPEDFRRARFIEHDLWVTAFNADERFAAGDTPNQNPGEPGLPQYVKNNENLTDADIVLWHTVGFHHVTAAEDFPVLPTEHVSFELKPANFFDRNPALDLRRAPFEAVP